MDCNDKKNANNDKLFHAIQQQNDDTNAQNGFYDEQRQRKNGRQDEICSSPNKNGLNYENEKSSINEQVNLQKNEGSNVDVSKYHL